MDSELSTQHAGSTKTVQYLKEEGMTKRSRALQLEIQQKHPPGFTPTNVLTVLRLIKTLYGLKQSGRCWYQKLKEICSSLVSVSTTLTRLSFTVPMRRKAL